MAGSIMSICSVIINISKPSLLLLRITGKFGRYAQSPVWIQKVVLRQIMQAEKWEIPICCSPNFSPYIEMMERVCNRICLPSATNQSELFFIGLVNATKMSDHPIHLSWRKTRGKCVNFIWYLFDAMITLFRCDWVDYVLFLCFYFDTETTGIWCVVVLWPGFCDSDPSW